MGPRKSAAFPGITPIISWGLQGGGSHRPRQTDTDQYRQTQTKTGRQRQRQTDTDRDRLTQTKTD